jgi:hypothetical protein
MWNMLPSLEPFVEYFRCIFTAPSFQTHRAILLGWIMCLGPRTLFRVFLSSSPAKLHDYSGPHGQDISYNFFERSAWNASDLFYRLALFVFTKLPLNGVIKLIVDDTLFHKRGIHVWGKGWFRDAVASTKNRVAIASGHNWVVTAVAFEVPFLPIVMALPVMARLHRTDEGAPTCSQLAREMICELLQRFPNRSYLLLGDGGYSNSELLEDLEELGKRLDYIGRMRSDAALYDPKVPEQPASKKGAKPKKGPRLPNPKEIARRAVPVGQKGEYQWQEVEVCAYGKDRLLLACTFIALWPSVLGDRPIRIIVVRDPKGVMDDCPLVCTNLELSLTAIIRNFSLRWAIEVMFKASKQVMDIEDPHHFCQKSVEKVAPWVLGLQTLISVWYVVDGRTEPEAMEIREFMGDWDTEWSLKNMLRVLRRAILNAAIKANSGDEGEMSELLEGLKNWAHLAT